MRAAAHLALRPPAPWAAAAECRPLTPGPPATTGGGSSGNSHGRTASTYGIMADGVEAAQVDPQRQRRQQQMLYQLCLYYSMSTV